MEKTVSTFVQNTSLLGRVANTHVLLASVHYVTTVSVTTSFACSHVATWKPGGDQRHAGENEEQLRGAAEETGGESVRAGECLSFTRAQA